MKERPILFSGAMVRALLAGTKTQTRRIVKSQPRDDQEIRRLAKMRFGDGQYHTTQWVHADVGIATTPLESKALHCPYGWPGDRLWVRETHAIVPRTAYAQSEGVQQALRPDDDHDAAIYREGWTRSRSGFRWRPSIHMPRWACRIVLEIVSVRVERLQDISEADALAEGVANSLHLPGGRFARENFEHLWWTINGDGSWEANPWVWVVEFKRGQP